MLHRIKLRKSFQVFLILCYIFLGFSSLPYSCLYIFFILNNICPSKKVYSIPEQYWHVWLRLSLTQTCCNWHKHVKKGVELLSIQIIFITWICITWICRRISWISNKQYHVRGFYILQLHLFMPLIVAGFLSTFTLKGCSTAGLILLTEYLARRSLSHQIIAQQNNRSSVK